MPSILEHQSNETTKLILIGKSGSGKTGALASLAAAGYSLRIIDMDNGLDVLRHYLSSPDSIYGKSSHVKDYGKLVSYKTFMDKRKVTNGRLIPTATAWAAATAMLQDWTDGETKLGPVTSWTSRDVLVVDSFSGLSDAAFRFVLAMNGRLGQKPWESDYGEAQSLLRNFLEIVIDPTVSCNVVLNCHIKWISPKEGDDGMVHGYPNAIGKALSPEIGRYFNTVLLAQETGTGPTAKRKIMTVPALSIGVKTTAPTKVAKEYDLATGLAEYFEAVKTAPKTT